MKRLGPWIHRIRDELPDHWLRILRWVGAPCLVLVVCFAIVPLLTHCGDRGRSGYALLVAHEAPQDMPISLGSDRENTLRFAEPGVDKVHGQLSLTEEGDWGYTHASDHRSAEFLEPTGFARWNDGGSAPRFALGPTSVILTGVPRNSLVTPEQCAGTAALPTGAHRHTVRSVPSSQLRLLDAEGVLLGSLDVPRVPGTTIPLAHTSLRVCEDGTLRVGGCPDGLALAPGGLGGRAWSETPLDTYAGLVLKNALAPVQTIARRDRIPFSDTLARQSMVLETDGIASQLMAQPDARHPVPLTEPDGRPHSASLLRRASRKGLEVVAHPRSREEVVHCHRSQPWWRRWGGEADWTIEARGTGTVSPNGLLLVGSSRYRIQSRTRPWGAEGSSTQVVSVAPTDRPTGLKALTSLAAGRLYQPGRSWGIPDCDRKKLLGLRGDPRSYAILQVRIEPEPAEDDLTDLDVLAQERPIVRVDGVDRSQDELDALRPVIDLPVPSWAVESLPSDQSEVALLHLCQGVEGGLHSRLVNPLPPGHPLRPVMARGSGELSASDWVPHDAGDQLAIGGQVLELRQSIPRYERTVPLLLLLGILLVSGVRTMREMILLSSPSGASLDELHETDPFAWSLPIVLGAISLLLLIGCHLQGLTSADPRLLGNPDFLQRTWFSSAIAAFAIPAALAATREYKWGSTELATRWRMAWRCWKAFRRETGWGLLTIATALVLDAVLWKLWGPAEHFPLMPSVQHLVLQTVVVLAALGGFAILMDHPWMVRRLSEAGHALLETPERLANLWTAARERPGAGSPVNGKQATHSLTSEELAGHLFGDTSPSSSVSTRGLDLDDLYGATDPASGLTAPEPLTHPEWARRAWHVFRNHPHIGGDGGLFGSGNGDLAAVLFVPGWLLGFAVVARAQGGAAHNNLEFGFGLGFKPAEIAAVFLGFGLARLLTLTWSRGVRGRGETSLRTRVPDETSGRSAFAEWADPLWLLQGPESQRGLARTWTFGAGMAVATVRYGIAVLLLLGLGALWLKGTIQFGVLAAALVAGALWEAAIRWAPDLSSILSVVALVLFVTTLTFTIQGDFGPLMVTVPAILWTVLYWSMPRSRERSLLDGVLPTRSLVSRVGAAIALVIGTAVASIATYHLVFDLQEVLPDLQRATERFLIKSDPWYAIGADWSIRAQWIAAGAYGEQGVAWVANLHSDLAWIALIQSLNTPFVAMTGLCYLVLVMFLIGVAEHTLERSEQPGVKSRTALRQSGFFCAFTAFYLWMEVVVHVASCFGWIPPTGLTLPWVSNGGSAALSYALLIGLALGLVLSARRRDLLRQGTATTASVSP